VSLSGGVEVITIPLEEYKLLQRKEKELQQSLQASSAACAQWKDKATQMEAQCDAHSQRSKVNAKNENQLKS